MGSREDKRIAALARKNAASIKPPKAEQRRKFDDTLPEPPERDQAETERLFKEMKRREF